MSNDQDPQFNDVDLNDDELFGLVGDLGAASNVAADASQDQEIRDMGGSGAWTTAEQLADADKRANPS